MSRKFDVVIGNPPYQEEAQGEGTRDIPMYHKFMDAAYEFGKTAVLVTPARFLFNAGFTPKSWNEKMLADEYLKVAYYVPHSGDLFPGTDIKGGIAITYRDDEVVQGPIGTFTKHPELNEILHKVLGADEPSISPLITSGRAYSYTRLMHEENPLASELMSQDAQFRISTNTFEQLDFLYNLNRPRNDQSHVEMLGLIKNKRISRWIRSDYIEGPDSLKTYKVAVAAANGSGVLGEVLSSPLVLEPDVAVTQTFITIGTFDKKAEANACLKYVKSKFARVLLGVMKTTQHNPARTWKYIPLQDFTSSSDIDWSKSIPEIDQQLYKKYKLNKKEIDFIESHVKPME